MPVIKSKNKPLIDSLSNGRFLEATKHLKGENADIKDLVKALHQLLGDEASVGGQLGVVVKHALQSAGIERRKFTRITSQHNPCLMGRLYNDKYEQATEYLPHEWAVSPEAEELIYALSNIMANPGWYGGDFATIKRWAVSNIVEGE